MIIQKKKLSQNNHGKISEKAKKFERDDNLYKKYIKTFDEFTKNFQRAQVDGNLYSLKQVCEKFYKSIKMNDNLVTDLTKQGEALNTCPENIFLLQKTLDVTNLLSEYLLVRENLAAALNNPNLWKSPEKLDKIASECREITFRCLKILKFFSMVNSFFALNLSNKPGFATKMLELTLQNPKVYFKQALSILEALIATNPATVVPSMYSLIHDILSNLPRKYFARFSRIIALMVLEPADKLIFKELPCQFSESRITKIHNFLLSIPNFVENYTIIIENLKQIMSCLIVNDPSNMQKILIELTESNIFKDSGLSLNGLKALLQQSHISQAMASEIFTPKFITKIVIKKSNITEILFVISNLLAGKRKIDTQDKLTKIGFFEKVLTPLFDILFHPSLELECHESQSFNEDCYCNNPLTTTRIQLLRIIINMCDRDSSNVLNKDLFLSPEEITLLHENIIQSTLKAHHPTIKSLDNSCTIKQLGAAIEGLNLKNDNNTQETTFFTPDMMTKNAFENVKEKGLLHKIVLLLNRVHPNSSFSFWLASCIESFLRGFHVPHQIFVAHTGMLHKLVKQIVSNEITRFNNIQISYDLLGEIVKFNKHNIIFLENLCVTYGWVNQLPQHALNNVVDSNVFFRSLWLSFEKFDYNFVLQKQKDPENKDLQNFREVSQVCQAFNKDGLRWFGLLVEAVEPSLISQDNICCINTSLILAIFAERNNNLEHYFNSLLSIQSKDKTNQEILENYRNVLSIWHKYYTLKTKDSFSLQFTSSLPFHSFQRMKQKIQKFMEDTLANMTAAN